eukprot:9484865-Pyramimonas_sp.AAC.2
MNQKGHIRRATGKKYKMLLKQESNLRRVHRRMVQCMADASVLTASVEREARGVLHLPTSGEVG